ncbi:JmjC domain-containing protein [Stenotrophomonas rhizophila]|uniref:JmjC domain-containing protein n=1 Tax=Stenotrophomonas rhizophila TaxID=216778 RepID=UPI00112F7341|nr:cupin domain-containing protein [Stenotrophomonas rhizophila]
MNARAAPPSALSSDRLAAKLLGALDERAFFQDIWERRELHLSAAFDVEEIAVLFPMDKFDEVLTSGSLMSPHLDIVRGGKKLPVPFTQSPSPAADVRQMLRELRDGSTVRVAHIEHYLPSLSRFCRGLEQVLHIPIRANLYMTPPFSQGFQPHYDLDDIFVVQVLGQKQWYWHSDYANQADLPNADMGFDAGRHASSRPPTPILLRCGDVLYLPRGFMHEARTDEHASIHITFATIGLNLGQFVEQLVRKLALSDVRLRRMVRFDPAVEPDPRELSELAALIADCLSNVASSKALAEASAFMRQSMANHRIADLQGRLMRGLNEGFEQD